MSGLPWFRCFPTHLREGMVGLTREERGSYITILTLIYERGGPVPDDDAWIAAQLWCSVRSWKKDRAALIVKGKLFEVNFNGTPSLMNERAADEIAKTAHISTARSEAGKTGGQRSAAKRTANFNENNDEGQANASGLLKQTASKREADNKKEDTSVASPKGEPTAQSPVHLDAKAWDEAKGLLVAQANMSLDAAGRFFGKLLSDHGLRASDMLGPIGEAFANATSDPKGYLLAAAKARTRRRQAATGPPKRVGYV